MFSLDTANHVAETDTDCTVIHEDWPEMQTLCSIPCVLPEIGI